MCSFHRRYYHRFHYFLIVITYLHQNRKQHIQLYHYEITINTHFSWGCWVNFKYFNPLTYSTFNIILYVN